MHAATWCVAGRMVEGLHHQLVFYASVAPLVAFYVFFAAVLYPASAHLHPHGFYAAAAPLVPIGLRGLLKVRLHSPAHPEQGLAPSGSLPAPDRRCQGLW